MTNLLAVLCLLSLACTGVLLCALHCGGGEADEEIANPNSPMECK